MRIVRRGAVPGRPLISVGDPHGGSLDLADGEIVVLLGPSGAGKTRWVRSLLGLDEGFFERTELLGNPASKSLVGQTIGWVPQGDGVFLSDTVWANVQAPRYVEACPPELAADALDLVGLADRAPEPATNLGWGGRRRVALARAVARRRPILVIDGPLDATLWHLFLMLRDTQPWLRGVLVASTVADDLAWRADSVALVAEGRVVCQAPMAELAESRDPTVRSVTTWVHP